MLKAWLALQALAITAGLTVAADLAAHKRTELVGGVNVWGYRGPVAPRKHSGEIRIAVVGGTRAFGWGGAEQDAVPATLYWMLSRSTAHTALQSRHIVSINLGAMGRPAADYAAAIAHYADLAPDYICIYDDLGLDTASVARSRTFAQFGYAPALPLVLEEKGMAIRFGSVAAGYDRHATGEASFVRRSAGALLQGLGRTLRRLDERPADRATGSYVDAMVAAIASARRTAKAVVVAVGPATNDATRANLAALSSRLSELMLQDPHVSLLDLGSVEGLDGPGLTLDGYNYNAAGRERVAQALGRELLTHIQRDLAP